MTDRELDPYVEWIAREAKRAVAIDPMAVERVMARIRLEPLPRTHSPRWRWILQPRALPISPLVGAALAAGLVGIGILLGHFQIDRGGQASTGRPTASGPLQTPRRRTSRRRPADGGDAPTSAPRTIPRAVGAVGPEHALRRRGHYGLGASRWCANAALDAQGA